MAQRKPRMDAGHRPGTNSGLDRSGRALAEETVKDPEDIATWAPVYAWRALGYLNAVDSVKPILAILNKLDEIGDDWYLEEIRYVFGLIGPIIIDDLFEYAMDSGNGVYPRIAALEGMVTISESHPETRDRVSNCITAFFPTLLTTTKN